MTTVETQGRAWCRTCEKWMLYEEKDGTCPRCKNPIQRGRPDAGNDPELLRKYGIDY